MTKLLAIVPAFNEAGAIAGTVAELRTHARQFDVLVIDDGSTDETAAIARRAGARVLSHPYNLGIGGGRQARHPNAAHKRPDNALPVDGGGPHHPPPPRRPP